MSLLEETAFALEEGDAAVAIIADCTDVQRLADVQWKKWHKRARWSGKAMSLTGLDLDLSSTHS